MSMRIAILPGDGIGKEVTAEAVKVVRAVLDGSDYELVEGLIGGAAFDEVGTTLPEDTIAIAQSCDAILLGGTGVPADVGRPPAETAGAALLRLRKALDLYANFRPAVLFPELAGASTFKPEIVDGLDLIILRELTGDLYFGEPRGIETDSSGERVGINTMRYTEKEIARVARAGFEAARRRGRKLCSVDKANVLETMQLWRDVVTEVGRDYPDVALSHLYVDAAAMELMRQPKSFDVIVTGNVFGDILSDAAAMLTGSIGMLPSASLGDDRKGLYEPVHGTAPDIAGQNIANPLAAILSAALMLRYSFDREDDAQRIENAVRSVLRAGYRTADIHEPDTRQLGTAEMGDAVVAAIASPSEPGAQKEEIA